MSDPGINPPLRGSIIAGLLDAGFASLAALAVGVYAARFFDASDLGTYALFFAALFVAQVFPDQLVFVPSEVRALRLEGVDRLAVIPPAIRLATAPSLIAAVGAALLSVFLTRDAPSEVVVPLAVTMAAAAYLMPTQYHFRRAFHLAGVSWQASIMSAVLFVATIAALVALTVVDVARAWIPLGSFATANLVSIAAGFIMMMALRPSGSRLQLRFSEVVRSGKWLLGMALVSPLTGLIVAALVVQLAGSDTLGYAEAARIASRPIAVIGLGLSAALRPRSMEAGRNADQATARRISRVYVGLISVLGAGYLAYAAFDWPGNIIAHLIPAAYAVGGLVAMWIIALTLDAMTFPHSFELVGARRERTLLGVQSAGNLLRAGVGGAAGYLGAFALPFGFIVLAGVRWIGFHRDLRTVYSVEPRSAGEVTRREPVE